MEEWIGYGREQAEAHPVAVAVTLAIFVVNALILIWWYHPLYGSNIGPPVFPILGSITLLLKSRDHFLENTVELIKNSPTHTIRFVRPGGTAVYSTAHVENVEYILKTRFENFVKGEYLGIMLGDLLGNGIFNVDGHLWKLQRKLASHEFTSRSLREFGFECADRELQDRLVPILTTQSSTAAIVDLQDLFLRFNFDNICQLGFGIDPYCLSPSLPAVRFADAFDAATELSVKRFGMLPITRALRQYFNLGTERKLREKVAIVNEFAHEVIQARRAEFATNASLQREDLLSRFMRFTDSEVVVQSELEQKVVHDLKLNEKEEASDVFLRDIVISFVLAGRDSISSGLSWFFLLIAQNPHVEAKLVEEIRGSAGGFSFEDLKKLHYLNGAVHEALRLFPPVPLDTKMALRDDVLPDGTVVRAGDRVTYNVFAMARMVDIWGEDCDEFKPERWLKDGVFVQESSFKFATFQAGPRICLGKELALLQMKQVAARLIDKFEFEVLNKHPPVTYRSIVLRMHNGLPVRVHARAN
jgi:cytochrome P450